LTGVNVDAFRICDTEQIGHDAGREAVLEEASKEAAMAVAKHATPV
jgi:hypothetical protein